MHHARLQRAGVGAFIFVYSPRTRITHGRTGNEAIFMHHFQQRYRFYLRKRKHATRCAPAKLYFACTKLFTTMARLPSNPEFLLEYLHDIPDESDSDENFDGYLDADEGPVAYRSVAEFEEECSCSTTLVVSRRPQRATSLGAEPLPLAYARLRTARERVSAMR